MLYGEEEQRKDYEEFEAVWWPVLNQATNHPESFLKGITEYVYPGVDHSLTREYKEHISKMVNDDMACLIFKNGERMFFRWAVETLDGRFWFSSKNLCLLPDGRVLKFD